MMAGKGWKSPLHEMTQTTPTALWNDSADLEELTFALAHGAVGATCNPVIAHTVIKSHLAEWRPRITRLLAHWPTATEDEIAWAAVELLSVDAAKLLEPAFAAHRGRNGRLSVQTDPRLYRDAPAIVRQAEQFDRLAPNIVVKIPATSAGIAAIEAATSQGITVNATVCFTLPQCVAVAEAIERGLTRRQALGHDVSSMGPVCTIMVGRLDDWLKAVAARDVVTVDPGVLEWAGVAVFKHAYRIFRERGFRTRLLSAAFRNHMHWSQLVGGDVVISPPFEWQVRLNASGIEPLPRIDDPVADDVLSTLYERFAEFRRAYDPDGMTIDEFQDYGATRRTLRQFLAACADLEGVVRDVLLPDPAK
jgi:transaldolase